MKSAQWVLLAESGARQLLLVPDSAREVTREGVCYQRTRCEVTTDQLAVPLVLAIPSSSHSSQPEPVHPLEACALLVPLKNTTGERLAFGSCLVATSELGELAQAVMAVVDALGLTLISLAIGADGVFTVDVEIPPVWSQRDLEHRAVLLEIAAAHLSLARGLGEPGPVAVAKASAKVERGEAA